MTPIIGDLIQSTVGKVVGKLVDKYLPASMSEEEKAKFRLEAERLAVEEIKVTAEAERVFMEDRKSAREREIAVKDKTPAILATVSFIGFFGILLIMMFVEIPPTAKDPLLIMLGALGAVITGITQYYYGSSSGSNKKSEMLERLMSGDRQNNL
ncbi:MAG: hypothetical protein WA162_01505 [Thermodesulfobacteriota bacterium]